ncbi:hypothetical protein DFH09DRAFT_1431908 [Mycena vulgaris]|nr:hypothetical protein DFH09DRAFT_1431908 [Mycena vulgaris]
MWVGLRTKYARRQVHKQPDAELRVGDEKKENFCRERRRNILRLSMQKVVMVSSGCFNKLDVAREPPSNIWAKTSKSIDLDLVFRAGAVQSASDRQTVDKNSGRIAAAETRSLACRRPKRIGGKEHKNQHCAPPAQKAMRHATRPQYRYTLSGPSATSAPRKARAAATSSPPRDGARRYDLTSARGRCERASTGGCRTTAMRRPRSADARALEERTGPLSAPGRAFPAHPRTQQHTQSPSPPTAARPRARVAHYPFPGVGAREQHHSAPTIAVRLPSPPTQRTHGDRGAGAAYALNARGAGRRMRVSGLEERMGGTGRRVRGVRRRGIAMKFRDPPRRSLAGDADPGCIARCPPRVEVSRRASGMGIALRVARGGAEAQMVVVKGRGGDGGRLGEWERYMSQSTLEEEGALPRGGDFGIEDGTGIYKLSTAQALVGDDIVAEPADRTGISPPHWKSLLAIFRVNVNTVFPISAHFKLEPDAGPGRTRLDSATARGALRNLISQLRLEPR